MASDASQQDAASQADATKADISPGDRVAQWAARGLLRLGRATPYLAPIWRQRRKLRRAGGQWFDVNSDDGRCLEAVHIPRKAAADATAKPLVVMAHGLGESKEWLAQPAIDLAACGHDVLLFDLRAHGESDGRVSTFGYRESDDFDRVIDAAEHRGVPVDRVVTFGFSAGAVAALKHAASASNVTAIVAIAPFASLREGTQFFLDSFAPSFSHEPLRNGLELATREAGFAPQDADARAAAREVTQPVLFICGCPGGRFRLTDQVKAVYKAKQQGYRELHEVDANHFQLIRVKWEKMRPAVEGFIQTHG